ncbi:MAG TPA: catalase [Pyrinomonadaceae bacterium]|nr:catalase [Pyrinomonadaceae bacterium]
MANKDRKPVSNSEDAKNADLERDRERSEEQFLTTNQGVRINDNQNSLKAGERGATLLEDFIMREKITHFDHERIPERIVHARGSAAHGYFQVYESMAKYTSAAFLQDPSVKTPVFARFSTVAGSRGSTDLARDIRGFAVKFYTSEGNYDLVGNNAPVFFIQDAMKFPDLVHAVKPEPHNEIPQAAAAHDTFWDFISSMPESMHAIMWAMSDRAIPRSFRMMEGFGVHTFRFINAKGRSHFVKFHWKPKLGLHSVLWDEATRISGKDPDFHRRDLWDAIEAGAFPEWEFGVQLVPEEDEHRFDFDLLDPTKIIPEEIVPVKRIGKMVLNRNPDNFFAETEQAAFHPGHIVPGIDFTNDPLLQGRLFSYLDTQLSRLGGPNFHEIPINRPVAPVHNNQRDGIHRQTINVGESAHDPNTLRNGCPFQAMISEGGFVSHAERIDGAKIRNRSQSFRDHFSQPTMFYNSHSAAEKKHILDALLFELGKVKAVPIRERMVGILTQIDKDLARKVAEGLGVDFPRKPEQPINRSFGADTKPASVQPVKAEPPAPTSPALSMENTVKDTIETRRIAVLASNGVDERSFGKMKKMLESRGAMVKVVAPRNGKIMGSDGNEIKVDETFVTTSSVLFDAVYLPGGAESADELLETAEAIHFVDEAFKQCKAIAAEGDGVRLLDLTYAGRAKDEDPFVFAGKGIADGFITAIASHRNWERELRGSVPA